MTAPVTNEIAGKYRIVGKLGIGAGGETFEAIAESDGTRVALKRLVLATTTDWKKVDLFQREARVLASLIHPAIPKYRESFVVETPHGPVSYLAHDFAPGKSLRGWVEEGWHPSEGEIIKIASFLLETLAYLHSLRPPVIHRDIKPANVIRSDDGRLWLVDFGAVRDATQGDVGSSTVVGTYGYMAPEQFRGQALPASDVYGVGATVLFLLGGKAPTDYPQANLKIAFRDVLRVSPFLTRWIELALEPTPERRFADARDALAVLRGEKRVAGASSSSFGRLLALLGALAVVLGVAGVVGAREALHAFARNDNATTPTTKASLPKEVRVLPERIYDAEYELTRERRTFDGRHTNLVTEIAIAHDDKTVASGSDGVVKLWDLAAGKELRSFGGLDGKVMGLAFTSDDKRLVTAAGNRLRVLDATSGAEVTSVSVPQAMKLALTKDDATAFVASRDGAVHVIDLGTAKERATYKLGEAVFTVALSPDETRVAAGGANGTAAIFDVTDGSRFAGWRPHTNTVDQITFSPDGALVASGGDDFRVAVTAIHSNGTTALDAEYANDNEVWGVAFSPDGRLLAAGSRDKSLSVIAMPQRWRAEKNVGNMPVSVTAFTHDGGMLVLGSGGQLGSMRLARHGSRTPLPVSSLTAAPPPRDDEHRRYAEIIDLILRRKTAEAGPALTVAQAAHPDSALLAVASARLELARGSRSGSDYSASAVSLARSDLEHAGARGPKSAEWWTCDAWIERAAKNAPAAHDAVRQAYKLVPHYPFAGLVEAMLDESAGSFDEAIGAASDVIAHTANPALLSAAYQTLAQAYDGAGDLDAADLAYQKVIVLEPEQPFPHSNYAIFLNRENEPAKAVAEAKTALGMADYGSARSALARAHVGVGDALLWEQHRVDDAVREYEEAITLDKQATAYYGRAAAYRFRALDGHDPSFVGKARADLDTALLVNPDFDQAKQARAELDRVLERARRK